MQCCGGKHCCDPGSDKSKCDAITGQCVAWANPIQAYCVKGLLNVTLYAEHRRESKYFECMSEHYQYALHYGDATRVSLGDGDVTCWEGKVTVTATKAWTKPDDIMITFSFEDGAVREFLYAAAIAQSCVPGIA